MCLAKQPDVSRTVSSERGEVEQVRKRGPELTGLSKVHPADLRWTGRAGVFAARTAWDHERRKLLHMHHDAVVCNEVSIAECKRPLAIRRYGAVFSLAFRDLQGR